MTKEKLIQHGKENVNCIKMFLSIYALKFLTRTGIDFIEAVIEEQNLIPRIMREEIQRGREREMLNRFPSLAFCLTTFHSHHMSSPFTSHVCCRCLMDKGFVRIGKWFFKPYDLEEKSLGNR